MLTIFLAFPMKYFTVYEGHLLPVFTKSKLMEICLSWLSLKIERQCFHVFHRRHLRTFPMHFSPLKFYN